MKASDQKRNMHAEKKEMTHNATALLCGEKWKANPRFLFLCINFNFTFFPSRHLPSKLQLFPLVSHRLHRTQIPLCWSYTTYQLGWFLFLLLGLSSHYHHAASAVHPLSHPNETLHTFDGVQRERKYGRDLLILQDKVSMKWTRWWETLPPLSGSPSKLA